MTLAGEAKVIADLNQRLVCIAKQSLCLPEAALRDVSTDAHVQLLLEFLEQVGTAFAGLLHHICDLDGFVDVGGNVLHAGIDFLRNPIRQLLLGHPSCKVQGHIILKNLYRIFGLTL